jgi:hypothetical protein
VAELARVLAAADLAPQDSGSSGGGGGGAGGYALCLAPGTDAPYDRACEALARAQASLDRATAEALALFGSGSSKGGGGPGAAAVGGRAGAKKQPGRRQAAGAAEAGPAGAAVVDAAEGLLQASRACRRMGVARAGAALRLRSPPAAFASAAA